MNILITDDSKEIRRRLIKVISKIKGINKIYQADSTQNSLTIFFKNKINLIILDISMPGKGGLYVLEQVKKEKPETTVLIFSSYTYVWLKKKCKALGINYFFDKSDFIGMITLLEDLIFKNTNEKRH